jgi:UDP-GlcNAc:undecaprenyl-phosphate GlcNAc-1-phosphate transferase
MSACAIPLVILIAHRTSFLDQPAGYKMHAAATPYLGGTAIILGLLVAVVVTGQFDGLRVPIAGMALLALVGTADDRFNVDHRLRLIAETAAAVALYAGGYGWHISGWAPLDLALTVFWVLALVNAYNLMDNMNGATGSLVAVSAGLLGALALVRGHGALAVMAFAACGACLGFLPFNARLRAKLFMGDGGSMPLGFLMAALSMGIWARGGHGTTSVVVALAIVALPCLDTAMVIYSRTRRGISVLQGGNDHLTYRVRTWVGTAPRVAAMLATAQAVIGALAITLFVYVPSSLHFLSLLGLGLAGVLVVRLDRFARYPADVWTPAQPVTPATVSQAGFGPAAASGVAQP